MTTATPTPPASIADSVAPLEHPTRGVRPSRARALARQAGPARMGAVVGAGAMLALLRLGIATRIPAAVKAEGTSGMRHREGARAFRLEPPAERVGCVSRDAARRPRLRQARRVNRVFFSVLARARLRRSLARSRCSPTAPRAGRVQPAAGHHTLAGVVGDRVAGVRSRVAPRCGWCAAVAYRNRRRTASVEAEHRTAL